MGCIPLCNNIIMVLRDSRAKQYEIFASNTVSTGDNSHPGDYEERDLLSSNTV
jgi:hypothetical protein